MTENERFWIASLAESVTRCSVWTCDDTGKPTGTTRPAPIPPHRGSGFMSYPPLDFFTPSGVSCFPRCFPLPRHAPSPCRPITYMACCKCCCGKKDCEEGDAGKCCCGDTCCTESEYCCGGACQSGPCCAQDEDCNPVKVWYGVGGLRVADDAAGACFSAGGKWASEGWFPALGFRAWDWNSLRDGAVYYCSEADATQAAQDAVDAAVQSLAAGCTVAGTTARGDFEFSPACCIDGACEACDEAIRNLLAGCGEAP